ncbi:MAG: aspartate aminotransferase family protein [Anaerolineae bacterium]|nr:aspartate aminotransferase family protein [Anaerolineae bacterium]
MAGSAFDLTPREVPRVNTPYRRIGTKIPVPESLETLETLRRYEPVAMTGQPPIVWHRAEGCQVYDPYGNMWLDLSSGVLVTNAGHGAPEIRQAIIDQANASLLHNYCFPSEQRALLAKTLAGLAPAGLDKVFLLTTGSEAIENSLKLARTWGRRQGEAKVGIVSFERAFHGRTLGAQQAGGIPSLKEWIVNLDPGFYQVPFPDGFRTEDTSFELFLNTLERQGATPDKVAAVITESFQGGGADFAPVEYMQALRHWCDEHHILLIADEVQAGFGRSGKFWAFEHYGIVPDLIVCGKGISSSLPLAAVIGRPEILDQYPPGSMTSTHTGNPVACMAAIANIKRLLDLKLTERAAQRGETLFRHLEALQAKFDRVIGVIHGKGLVAGIQIVRPGTKDPDTDLAHKIVEKSYQKGLLFFAPVGYGAATVKIAPPLVISNDMLDDAFVALNEAFAEAIDELGR